MYLGQFFDPNLMMDLARQTEEYQTSVDTGPVPETTPALPSVVPTKAGMGSMTLLLIGGVLFWLMTKK